MHEREFVRYLKAVCQKLQSKRPVYPYVFPIRRPERRPKDLAVRAGYYCIDTFTPLDRNAYDAARAAVEVAEKLRREIETHVFMWDGKSLKITASIGAVAHPGQNVRSWKQLLESADQAMYLAKEAGRNRVTAYTVEEKKI